MGTSPQAGAPAAADLPGLAEMLDELRGAPAIVQPSALWEILRTRNGTTFRSLTETLSATHARPGWTHAAAECASGAGRRRAGRHPQFEACPRMTWAGAHPHEQF